MRHGINRIPASTKAHLRIAPLVLLLLLLAACAGKPAPAEVQSGSYNLKVSGSVRDWNLGEGFYVFLGEPAVGPAAQAEFPERYAAAPIGPDGSFSLELTDPPARLDDSVICEGGHSRSFHYLAVTGRPEAGEDFSELAVIRPVPDGDELLFLTWMDNTPDSDCTEANQASLDEGWHVLSFTGSGGDQQLNGELEPAQIEWVLRH